MDPGMRHGPTAPSENGPRISSCNKLDTHGSQIYLKHSQAKLQDCTAAPHQDTIKRTKTLSKESSLLYASSSIKHLPSYWWITGTSRRSLSTRRGAILFGSRWQTFCTVSGPFRDIAENERGGMQDKQRTVIDATATYRGNFKVHGSPVRCRYFAIKALTTRNKYMERLLN